MKKRESEREAERSLKHRYQIDPTGITVSDYAWMVRFTKNAVYQALKRGALPHKKTATGRYRIKPTAEVKDYIRSRKSDDAEDYMDYMCEADHWQHPDLGGYKAESSDP